MTDSLATRITWAIATIKDDRDLDKGITDVDLAKILGTDKNTVARYRYGKGLLKGEMIERLVLHYHFSPSWLFKGEGEPFPGARAKYKDVCGPEPLVGHAYIKDASAPCPTASRGLIDPTSAPAQPHQEIRVSEAMTTMARVLESGTSYATALYLNIVHFARAVAAETTMSKCQDDLRTQQDDLHTQGELIAQMQTRLYDLDRQNKKLREEMKDLKKTSGDSPPIALGMDHADLTGTEDPGA